MKTLEDTFDSQWSTGRLDPKFGLLKCWHRACCFTMLLWCYQLELGKCTMQYNCQVPFNRLALSPLPSPAVDPKQYPMLRPIVSRKCKACISGAGKRARVEEEEPPPPPLSGTAESASAGDGEGGGGARKSLARWVRSPSVRSNSVKNQRAQVHQ